jgi:hypothetical protein
MAQEIISDGLAVGYYYNFVKRLFDLLTEETVGKAESKTYSFTYDEVQLTIVLPSILTDEVIGRCRDRVFSQPKLRLIAESGRDMSVFVEKLETVQKVMLDYPTTLGAIIDYLAIDNEGITGFPPLERTSEEWRQRTQQELRRFREILEYLVSSYPATAGKVDFLVLD